MNNIPVIDMHSDTISVIHRKRLKGQNTMLRSNDLSIDLERMKQAGYMCQNFALFIMMKHWMDSPEAADGADGSSERKDILREMYPSPFDYVIALSDLYDNEIQLNSDVIRPALSGTEIEFYHSMGLMSALKTVEEGAVYAGKVENLEKLYDHGVRMTTLTWNFENELAFPNIFDFESGRVVPDREHGLKDAGKDVVKACSELGIIIDVSHLGDAGISDVLDIVPAGIPIVASHSNARAVTAHPRNLTDDMLRKIGDRGGVCGLNFCSAFANGMDDGVTRTEDLVKHIRHMAATAGIEAIGLGSDYDGIGNEVETGGCEGMQKLADAIVRAGYSEDDAEKIFFRNVLRMYKEVLG